MISAFLSGLVLLALIAGVGVAANWREVKAAWRDVTGPVK